MSPAAVPAHGAGVQHHAEGSSFPVPGRLLLLSPPSISSHPDKLNEILETHRRDSTDLQMLDRLAAGLVSLPESTYGVIILLSDADGTRTESSRLLNRQIYQLVVRALRPGGRFTNQEGASGNTNTTDGLDQKEAILAGLIVDDSGALTKPDFNPQESVPLKLGKRKTKPAPVQPDTGATVSGAQSSSAQNDVTGNAAIQGVGFVDFSDDFAIPPSVDNNNNGSDDELIDEEDLLDEDDMGKPIVQPPECRPKAGKRRRACKDCSCGLARKLESEDIAKRADADKALDTMKLESNDLTEVDFTVQGKVGSCGSCALGDAFRCDGCPYIGLPAFKPGEEVRLLNNDVQL